MAGDYGDLTQFLNQTRRDTLDFSSQFVVIPDDQPKEVIKPWGKEELIEYVARRKREIPEAWY